MDGSVHDVSHTYPWAKRLRPACRELNSTNLAGHTEADAEREGGESIMNSPERRPDCLAGFNTELTRRVNGADR